MSFFNDLRLAASDLAKGGLNLDQLREEIGNEARAPLPPPPPRRGGATRPDDAIKLRAEDEQPLNMGGGGGGGGAPSTTPEKPKLSPKEPPAFKGNAGPPEGALQGAPSSSVSSSSSSSQARSASPPPPPKKPLPAVEQPNKRSPPSSAAADSEAPAMRGSSSSSEKAAEKAAAAGPTSGAFFFEKPPSKAQNLIGGLRGKLAEMDDGIRASLNGPMMMDKASSERAAAAAASSQQQVALREQVKQWESRAREERAKADKWEREAAAQREEAARLEAEVVALGSSQAKAAVQVANLKRTAQDAERKLGALRNERDACAAELEAVALREVDALQAEVASLRKHKARADKAEGALDVLQREVKRRDAESKLAADQTDDVRRMKRSLDAAREAAAAAARCARAHTEAADQRCADLRAAAAAAERRCADAEARALSLQRDNAADRAAASSSSSSSPRSHNDEPWRQRESDAGELRVMLREALEDAAAAKKRASDAERHASDLEAKTKRDLDYSAGELAAARDAAREARKALVQKSHKILLDHHGAEIHHHAPPPHNKNSSSPSACSSKRAPATTAFFSSSSRVSADVAADDGASEGADSASADARREGAVEYLSSVVRTVLPRSGAKIADAATRNRLHPVLRSLLSLPHETVVNNLDALALTGTGGDFALALLAAAEAGHGALVSQAAAKLEAQHQAHRVILKAELDEAKEAHREAKRQLAALGEELDLSRKELDLERAAAKRAVGDLAAKVGAAQERAVALEALALAASNAAADALRAREAEAALQRERRAHGLDAEQLEYLRATLVRYLRSEKHIKRQLSPVLLSVLKLKPDDDHAQALLEITLSSS